MKQKWLIIFALILCSYPITVQAKQYNIEPVALLSAEDGPNIISYSDAWSTPEQLTRIRSELYSNTHGTEMQLLKEVVLRDGSNLGLNGAYTYSVKTNDNGQLELGPDSRIELYHADTYTEVRDLAPTIAHEYGHHFTIVHFIQSEGKDTNDWKDTPYGVLRNLSAYPEVIYEQTQNSYYKHKWDVSEIAAEDYVQLLGSPLAKTSVIYKDVEDRLREGTTKYTYSSDVFNLLPQENLNLPLATQVTGLFDYFSSFLDEKPLHEPSAPIRPSTLEIVQHEIAPEHFQYIIEWPEADGDFEYTLVLYPLEDASFPIAVKTVYSGDSMRAAFGSGIRTLEDGQTYAIIQNFEGPFIFRLFMKDTHHFMYASEPYLYHFESALNDTDRIELLPA